MCMSFCTLPTAVIALPSAPFGARLKDTVTAGNCPWWLMESGSAVCSKCEKALSGTALLVTELVAPAEFAPVPNVEKAFDEGARVCAGGVYCADLVSAFEPAEDDPEDAKDVDAPAPLAPADALDWM